MVICGQEFEFSLMNANDLDRFEDANERMQRRSAEESEQFRRGGIRLGDHARAQARIAMDCIDEILGAGSSDRLGLNENYMAPIYDVIEELGNAFSAEKQRYAAKPSQPMNREQRRAQAAKAQAESAVASRSGLSTRRWQAAWTQQPIRKPEHSSGRTRKPGPAARPTSECPAGRPPDAMQQLAAYALQIAAERHV